MTVFRKTQKGVSETVLGEDDTYATELLPGFELSLRELFGLVDRLEQALEDDETNEDDPSHD